MGPTLAGKFIFIGSCDSDEDLNADTVVDGKWFLSNGLQSIPGAKPAAGTCLWDCPAGCWGEREAGMSHTITQRKLQILHSFSKHLVFIQTLLPFHTAGYFSLKGNSCPINKGWWEGAWGRLFRMQEAFSCVLQLGAGQHQSRDGLWHMVGTTCASKPCGTWSQLGQPQPSPARPRAPPSQPSWGSAGAAPGPAVPVGQGLAGSWCSMEMRDEPGKCLQWVFHVVPGCKEDFSCPMMDSSPGPGCCWAVWDLANVILF